METDQSHGDCRQPHHHHDHHLSQPHQSLWRFWILGIGSLLWFALRTGTRPSRAVYPCQRAAAATGLSFLAYLGALLGGWMAVRKLHLERRWGWWLLYGIGLAGLVLLPGSVGDLKPVEGAAPAIEPTLPAWTSPSAVSNVFVATHIPTPTYSLDGGVIPAGVTPAEALHDAGVDALITSMESNQDYFYKTAAHPQGLFAGRDVVVIKVNNQWGGRYGTNTDVVKGLIYRLTQHPDGFAGAVIIAENPQGQNADWYADPNGQNNSQFQDQSYQDVAQAFAGQGYHVCFSDWKVLRSVFVADYNAGNSTDGYVLDAADPKLSYPKFAVNCGGAALQISMRYGLWNGSTFDAASLKMINVPVLKRHGSHWATAAVKNYVGFMSTVNYNNRFSGVSEVHCWLTGPSDNGYSCTDTSTRYGLIGRQMARIRRADLDLVDAVWVDPDSNTSGRTYRLNVLMASRDPFALDYYATDYLLGPLIHTYNPTAAYTQAMASTSGGWFRNFLVRQVGRLRAEGITNTIQMTDTMTPAQELAQFNVFLTDAAVTPPVLTPRVYLPVIVRMRP